MMLMTSINDSKPQELINLAMIRGKMCELLAVELGQSRPDRYYTLGLLSVMDAMLDKPMENVITLLPLATDMNEALLHRTGDFGSVLASVMKYEEGLIVPPGSLTGMQMKQAYQKTLRWIADCGIGQ